MGYAQFDSKRSGREPRLRCCLRTAPLPGKPVLQQIEWDVANTDQAPVNADGDEYFSVHGWWFHLPILLADSLENNGTALVSPDTFQGTVPGEGKASG